MVYPARSVFRSSLIYSLMSYDSHSKRDCIYTLYLVTVVLFGYTTVIFGYHGYYANYQRNPLVTAVKVSVDPLASILPLVTTAKDEIRRSTDWLQQRFLCELSMKTFGYLGENGRGTH